MLEALDDALAWHLHPEPIYMRYLTKLLTFMWNLIVTFQIVQEAVDDARDTCIRTFGSAPHVAIHGNPRLTLAYVPSHLHHMVFELVKNSLRAVQVGKGRLAGLHETFQGGELSQ